MKAKVIKEFPGRPEGEALARQILVGEEIDGELATVAVREGWADEIGGSEKPAAVRTAESALARAQAAVTKAADKAKAATSRAAKSKADTALAEAKANLEAARKALAEASKPSAA